MPDDEIKRLMKNLEESINETLSQSPQINESIQEIKASGYEVFLVIDATIGFNPRIKGDRDCLTSSTNVEEPVRLRITSEDAKFLKSLKIAIDQ